MGRGKKIPAAHRGGGVRDRHARRGSDEKKDEENLEDDPLQDLRPQDEDTLNAAGDDYVWPDLHDENEDDD
jgi:hypothetical protein